MYAKSATGGLHSAKAKQSITCTPKVRLEDYIVPKENRALHVSATGGLHSAKRKQTLHVSATGGLHSAKRKQTLHVSATGGLHSAKRKQSITCKCNWRIA